MKTRVEKLEDKQIENVTDIAVITERVDKHDVLLDFLEKARHKDSGRVHAVEGILAGIDTSVNKLVVATDKNTRAVDAFKIMAMTATVMGGCFLTFCSFVGGKILLWW